MSESYTTGSSGNEQSASSIEGPRCFCDLRAISTTAFTDENWGRRFWGCVKYKDGGHCNYFAWRDPKMCAYGRRLIRQLREMHGQKLSEEISWESISGQLQKQNKNIEAIIAQHREEIDVMASQHRLAIEAMSNEQAAKIEAMTAQHRCETQVERKKAEV
ncbi:hypothetical protein CJ030_MR3G019041 [Morella rubra]|uniref:GRF-type domain-containing protein n=1 Tax=Morella rubra TaxID=262757 RepID=A0A6A1W5A6_9ROSI|nr:hypothetical protein CJ030_MR3G019041 [Morella rubra]